VLPPPQLPAALLPPPQETLSPSPPPQAPIIGAMGPKSFASGLTYFILCLVSSLKKHLPFPKTDKNFYILTYSE
jgi:hypothetical protein